MKNLSLRIFLLLVQIHLLVSEVESKSVGVKGSRHHIGHLIKTKSGKVFLHRSSKKDISSTNEEDEGGHDYSNDDEVQVTGNIHLTVFFLCLYFLSSLTFVNLQC